MRFGVLIVAAMLAGCGQAGVTDTNKSASESSDVVQAQPQASFTRAQWEQCAKEVRGISPDAQRGFIRAGHFDLSDDDVQRVVDDENTKMTIAPAPDGSCSRMLGSVDTIVNGNQVRFVRECTIMSFDDRPDGKVIGMVTDCKPFDGQTPS